MIKAADDKRQEDNSQWTTQDQGRAKERRMAEGVERPGDPTGIFPTFSFSGGGKTRLICLSGKGCEFGEITN